MPDFDDDLGDRKHPLWPIHSSSSRTLRAPVALECRKMWCSSRLMRTAMYANRQADAGLRRCITSCLLVT